MNMKFTLVVAACFISSVLFAQQSPYLDSMQAFRDRYISTHEVVKPDERQFFRFAAIDSNYRIQATVERIEAAPWMMMPTSGAVSKSFRVYARLHFTIHDTTLVLCVYQSEQLIRVAAYANYLFIPFTDKSSGNTSYDNGRYIDLTTDELSTGSYTLDFNKAYNPYCAYVSGRYNCPVPPPENDLPVMINAGELRFAGH